MPAPSTVPTAEEEYYWVNHAVDTLLHFDEVMFPQEDRIIISTSDIDGEISYFAKENAYLFNQESFVANMRKKIEPLHMNERQSFYLVQVFAVILSAYGVRLRAWELFKVPVRTLRDVLHDERIPWLVRHMLLRSATIKEYQQYSIGDLRHTREGKIASQNLDLTIISALASHMYREGLSAEWLRPFIVT